jgi:predicted DNA-binding protein
MVEELKSTTIKISDKTKERLDHLREHKEESLDSIINKSINILNICMRNPSLASKILRDIEKSKKRKELLENSDSIIKKKSENSMPAIQQKIVNAQKNMQMLRK